MCWRAGGRTSQVPPVGALLTRIATDAMPAAGSVAGSTPGRASACGPHGKGCACLRLCRVRCKVRLRCADQRGSACASSCGIRFRWFPRTSDRRLHRAHPQCLRWSSPSPVVASCHCVPLHRHVNRRSDSTVARRVANAAQRKRTQTDSAARAPRTVRSDSTNVVVPLVQDELQAWPARCAMLIYAARSCTDAVRVAIRPSTVHAELQTLCSATRTG